MAGESPTPSSDASQAPTPSSDRPLGRPWRTEGLPHREPPGQRPRWWITIVIWAIGYLLLFGVFTIQDQLAGPQPIAYTEFKSQVANRNVSEVFARGDSIQGQLRKAAPVPGEQDRTYQQFTTERPTFAGDDLLAELTEGGAAVRATPLVEQRGIITNLLISFAPLLLLIAFWTWFFASAGP